MINLKRIVIVLASAFLSITTLNAQKNSAGQLVEIETNYGTMKFLLYDSTPQHRDNFVKLVKSGFYNGLLFHRVINNFMIQGGDPQSRACDSTAVLGSGDLEYTIPAEIDFPEHFHKKGALAAARLGDAINPERASSACQFYVVQGKTCNDKDLDNIEHRLNMLTPSSVPFKFTEEQRRHYKMFGGTPHLDGQYTVFGELIKGFDVLDKIAHVATNDKDRPLADVIIIRARLVKR